MKGFVMSGLRTFSCVVVLCGAMANVAIASPKIEARGELGRFVGGIFGGAMGGVMGGAIGAPGGPVGSAIGRSFGHEIGREFGREIGDRVEDYIRGVDREPQTREPIRDFYDYGYSFGHAW
ncbi:pantothenate kinase [Helicobacter pylori]|nr:pantothenate kinase [Helicobacter pylori]